MMRVGNFVLKQSQTILENKQYAMLCAVLFSIIPFASWLSIAIVALVTSRKGAKSGFEIMLPALVIHSVPLLMLVPLNSVLINSLLAYLPCYIVALCLRKTANWSVVFGGFFIQACVYVVLINVFAPDFVLTQLNQFKMIIGQNQEYQQLLSTVSERISDSLLAQLFIGIQILSIVVSTMISLLFARSIQSRLFMPEGFREELRAFRSSKVAFFALVVISFASYYEIPGAISLMPLLISYFFISGFALTYCIFAGKRQKGVLLLLLLLIILQPTLVLFAYIVFGSLDSLFNFRLYLPTKVREST